ncbi:L,D-transpeptidase scaffold domain-containing protein [Tsuneonella sp. HG222]
MFRSLTMAAAVALLVPLPSAAQAQSAAGMAASQDLRKEIGKRADKDLRGFYAARGNAPIWLDAAGRPTGAATLLLYRLRTAEFDGLDPRKIGDRKLASLVERALRGDEDDQARAEVSLSAAFADYVRGMRAGPSLPMIYESEALKPAIPSRFHALQAAAAVPSLESYIDDMGWMHPYYAPLRKAMEDPTYSSAQRRQIWTNLARARAIPAMNQGRYVLVDTASARLWMYENGRPVDSMKVVVGKPDQQTPAMAGFIRHAIHSPYWNVPDDLVRTNIAANVLDQGQKYLSSRGYQVLDGWTADAKVIDPKTVDWLAVHEGLRNVHVRQLPGGDNFMGAVKFEFPNPQGIYLHDTPDLHLMKESARQLSSGCVRLEDAGRMHKWLLGTALPKRGKKTQPEQQVNLAEPVPIYITYLTVQPGQGELAFLDDPYARDTQVRVAAN